MHSFRLFFGDFAHWDNKPIVIRWLSLILNQVTDQILWNLFPNLNGILHQ